MNFGRVMSAGGATPPTHTNPQPKTPETNPSGTYTDAGPRERPGVSAFAAQAALRAAAGSGILSVRKQWSGSAATAPGMSNMQPGLTAGRRLVGFLVASAVLCGAPERPSPETARMLENPVFDASDSVRRGRNTYLRLCQYCHGADGRAQANPDFEAPSLRAPDEWRYGKSDGELFVSIRFGAGHDMPPFAKQLSEEQTWELVVYIRSIGPRELRPGRGKQER